MSRPLDPLWRLLDEQADPAHPVEGWRRELGEAFDLAEPWLRAARGRATTWPCGLPGGVGCLRRVVEHAPDDVVAVCGDEPPRCARVEIARTDLALRRLDLEAVAEVVHGTSGLPHGELRRQGREVVIGPLTLGGRRVVIAITRETSTLALLELAEGLSQRHVDVRVLLLAPIPEAPEPANVRAFERVSADVLPLRDVVVLDGGRPVADLSDWLLHRRGELAGIDPLRVLARRYDLVVDGDAQRCGVRGTWVSLRRHRLPYRLLVGLAKRPEAVVVRDQLFDELWPDEHPSNMEAWEVNLRSNKSKLDKLLRPAVGAGGPMIETVAGDELTGGYRLLVPAGRVAWWSRPYEQE